MKIQKVRVAPAVLFANGDSVPCESAKTAQTIANGSRGSAVVRFNTSFSFEDGTSVNLGLHPAAETMRIVKGIVGDTVTDLPEVDSEVAVPASGVDKGAIAHMVGEVIATTDAISQYISPKARTAYYAAGSGGGIELSYEIATPAMLDHTLCTAIGNMPWVQQNGFPGVWAYEVTSELGQEINSVLVATGVMPTEKEMMEVLAASAVAFFERHDALNTSNPNGIDFNELCNAIRANFGVKDILVAFDEEGVTATVSE